VDESPQYTINHIGFTGNATIPDEFIRPEILLKEGQVFNVSRLEASLPKLNQLGLFDEIKFEDFQVTPLPNEPKLDIVLKVKESGR
jgi:outer membrane protein assembly factor BamA